MANLRRQQARFVDINSLYKVNTRPELVQDLEAIYNSLFNLLNCPVGSRFWEPEYGCSLKSYLQEPCDDQTATDIEVTLLQSIMRWEPRLSLDRKNTFVVARSDKQGFNIQISGTDILTGQPFTTQFAALRDDMTSDITI